MSRIFLLFFKFFFIVFFFIWYIYYIKFIGRSQQFFWIFLKIFFKKHLTNTAPIWYNITIPLSARDQGSTLVWSVCLSFSFLLHYNYLILRLKSQEKFAKFFKKKFFKNSWQSRGICGIIKGGRKKKKKKRFYTRGGAAPAPAPFMIRPGALPARVPNICSPLPHKKPPWIMLGLDLEVGCSLLSIIT